MRQRPETLSPLGRAPARQSQQMPPIQPPQKPPETGGLVRQWLRGALFDNPGLKFLSLVLAVTVFLLVNTDKEREITVRVGVKYEYPADKVLASEPLEEVRVTIKGPWRRLRSFDERELGRVTLDLRNAPSSDVPITPELIVGLPPGLSVMSITPRSVRVAFDKRIEKLVEIVPVLGGLAQHGYQVAEAKAVPATIKVRGGEKLLQAIGSIKTLEVSVEGRTEPFEQLAEVAAPEGVAVDPTLRIRVDVRISKALVERTYSNLGLTLKPDGNPAGFDATKWTLVPDHVEVTLTGELLAVEKAKDTIVPVVKIAPNDLRPRDAEVTIEGLPRGVGVRISSERVKVTPPEKGAPAKPPAPP